MFADLIPDVVTENSKIFSFPNPDISHMSIDVVVSDKAVILKEMTHHTGVSVNGKTWHSWKPTATTIYSLKKERYGNNRLRVYKVTPASRRRGHRGFFHDVSRSAAMPYSFTHTAEGKEAFKDIFFEGVYIQKSSSFPIAYLFALWNVVQKWKQLNPLIDLHPVPVENLLLYMAYPALQLFIKPCFEGVKASVMNSSKPWLGEPDVRIFLRQNLGKEAVRKDFIKATANLTDSKVISFCAQLKGVVPVDWFLPWFKEGNKYSILHMRGMDNHTDKALTLKRLMVRASLAQKRRMFIAEVKTDNRLNDGHWVSDTIRMLDRINDETLDEAFPSLDFTTWKSLHDSLNLTHRYIQLKPQPVPQKGLMEELDEKFYMFENETYIIRSPKVNQELVGWGQELSNCIASYSNSVLLKQTDVFAVYTEDKLYANLEVRNGRLLQFVARYNQSVPVEMIETMTGLLRKAETAVKEKEHEKKLGKTGLARKQVKEKA